jgi:hypothetical protein
MKNLIAIAALLLLTACTIAVAEKTADGFYTVKNPISKYDPLASDSLLSEGAGTSMNYQALKVCPGGYEKIRDYLRHLPDRNSYYAWDIRCL